MSSSKIKRLSVAYDASRVRLSSKLIADPDTRLDRTAQD